jgi:hypothetical protein
MLVVMPVIPSTISRVSALWMPNSVQQDSSPRISVHVPGEIPLGRSVRYAVHTDGAAWSAKAPVSAAPSPALPAARPTATSSATHTETSAAGLACARPRRASIVASAAASSDAEHDGTRAVQYCESVKYAIHAALFALVSVAHDHETPAASPVARSLRICGRNWGMANAAAANGTQSRSFEMVRLACQ